LWGEREQAAFILTEERMMYQMLLSDSEVTIVLGSLRLHNPVTS